MVIAGVEIQKMSPRRRFDSKKFLENIKQMQMTENKQMSYFNPTKDKHSISLTEASQIIYEHITERSKKDSSLHDDILKAGLGEPLAQDRIKAVIDTLLMEYHILIDPSTLIDDLSPTDCIFAETCGASLIEDILKLPDVEEIQVIGCEIFLIANAETKIHHRKFSSLSAVRTLQDRLALCGKKPINEKSPFLQSYLWNRSRLVMTREPYTDVPSIHVRNFIVKDVTLQMLIHLGTINPAMSELLTYFVKYHASFLIGGSTNTGKTTFLFGLCQEINKGERIRTLEKEFEISLRERLKGNPNVLAAREDELSGLTMENGFKPLLVMSPHWVVIGESKGAEVAQAVQGALRGHDVMTTMHTKYRESLISDVVDMIKQDGRTHDYEDTVSRVARAFNIVVYLKIVRINGRNVRVATEITELSVDGDNKPIIKPLVLWDYTAQTWKFTGQTISEALKEHLISNGAEPEQFIKLGVW
jgi:pilus assembly protein CpaF